MSSGPGRIQGLDVLRSLAVLSVFVFHYPKEHLPGALLAPALVGWLGVDLFFVLSGFLIASQWLAPFPSGESPSPVDFYVRRAFRILPSYLLTLFIYWAWPAFHEDEALPPVWRFLTFTQNFGLDRSVHATFSHAWSLCVEEHFYLLFPTCSVVVFRFLPAAWAWLVFVAIFAAGLWIRGWAWDTAVAPLVASGDDGAVHIAQLRAIYYPTYCRLDGLLCGVLLASVRVFLPTLWSRMTKWGNLFLGLGLLVLIASLALIVLGDGRTVSVWSYPAAALAFGLLVLSGTSPNSLLNRIWLPGVGLVAAISYPLYLIHKGTIHLVHLFAADHALADGQPVVLFAASLLSASAAAAALHYGLEKPFLRQRDLLFGKLAGLRVKRS